MEIQWIKLSTDIFRNAKMVQLRSMKQGEKLMLIWIMLLVLSGRCNRGGRLMLTDQIPYDIKMLSKELGVSPKTLEFAFGEFVRLNMTNCVDGVWEIRNWEKYQNIEGMERIKEQKRIAQSKWRAKQKTSTVDSTRYLVDGTEEEEEKETEKEKEFHSFCQAQNADLLESKKRSFLGGELGAGVVMLSEEQMDNLLQMLSLEEFDKYVAVVRDMELSGRHYKKKTHYQAILDMAKKDRCL